MTIRSLSQPTADQYFYCNSISRRSRLDSGVWGKRENVPDCLQSRWTDFAEMLRDEGTTFIKCSDFTKTDFLFPSRWRANVLLHFRLAPFRFNNSNYSPFIVKRDPFFRALKTYRPKNDGTRFPDGFNNACWGRLSPAINLKPSGLKYQLLGLFALKAFLNETSSPLLI